MESVREYGGLVLDQTKPLESVQQGYTYFRDGHIVVAKIVTVHRDFAYRPRSRQGLFDISLALRGRVVR